MRLSSFYCLHYRNANVNNDGTTRREETKKEKEKKSRWETEEQNQTSGVLISYIGRRR